MFHRLGPTRSRRESARFHPLLSERWIERLRMPFPTVRHPLYLQTRGFLPRHHGTRTAANCPYDLGLVTRNLRCKRPTTVLATFLSTNSLRDQQHLKTVLPTVRRGHR